MTLTRVFPEPEPEQADAADLPRTVDGLDQASRDWLLRRYAPKPGPYLRVNMIASMNGSVTGADNTSDSLSSRLDRRILGVIRQLADVVLIGAGSVRTEGYVVPARATLAVVTASGDLSGHRLEPPAVQAVDRTSRVLVLCPRTAVARAEDTTAGSGAVIVALDDDNGQITPATVVAALSRLSLTRIVCEGGPVLAGQFFAADLVDELCLSTSPQIVLGARGLLESAQPGATGFSLRQLLLDDQGAVFARWERSRPASS
ncbi:MULTISPECIES: dihydrofolate reductase family protein [Cryobacterium]|uniref:Pyrimidine reductase n=1 Tax=Cryobacterium breve TaxID=1259258 RepID=A0ABY2IXC4_9MICO|nr:MULTISPECIES: dihydrofolate reductase family protein [Cryobacterium]TFC97044.1 pyrimidine reductase [Cryobacterium sp. TmT3-12]TFC97160.1 pyrimidine reductase [Cryobacterium breve]